MNSGSSFKWTEDRIREFRGLCEQGVSYGNIAKIMSARHGELMTRNAAIGKGNRMGFKRSAEASRLSTAVSRIRMVKKKAAPPKPVAPARPPLSYPKRRVTEVPEPVSKELGLMQLDHRDCRWITSPVGDADSRYCGHRAVMGEKYCTYHAYKSLTPEGKKRKYG